MACLSYIKTDYEREKLVYKADPSDVSFLHDGICGFGRNCLQLCEVGFNVINENSTELVVFEAAIDLMSYVDIFTDYESNKLALGMLADAPLETFLREHPQITSIRFCLDGD